MWTSVLLNFIGISIKLVQASCFRSYFYDTSFMNFPKTRTRYLKKHCQIIRLLYICCILSYDSQFTFSVWILALCLKHPPLLIKWKRCEGENIQFVQKRCQAVQTTLNERAKHSPCVPELQYKSSTEPELSPPWSRTQKSSGRAV